MRRELEDRGWTTEDTGDVGKKFGDFLAGKDGETYIIEAKAPERRGKKERPYEVKQRERRERWRGAPWIVAFSVEDILVLHRSRGHVA